MNCGNMLITNTNSTNCSNNLLIPKTSKNTKTTKTSFVQVKTIVYDVVSVFFSL